MENLEGKIIFEGKSKNGQDFLIRYVKHGDAQAMTDYMNILSSERTFIRYQGEQLSLKKEEEYVLSQIDKVQKGRCIELLVFTGEKLIGIANLDLGERTDRHIAGLGISIAADFRREGIGSKLLESVIQEGRKNLTGLELITLGVFANNQIAIDLYKKFGFRQYGTLPDGVKLKDGYVDHLEMYKLVKEF